MNRQTAKAIKPKQKITPIILKNPLSTLKTKIIASIAKITLPIPPKVSSKFCRTIILFTSR